MSKTEKMIWLCIDKYTKATQNWSVMAASGCDCTCLPVLEVRHKQVMTIETRSMNDYFRVQVLVKLVMNSCSLTCSICTLAAIMLQLVTIGC